VQIVDKGADNSVSGGWICGVQGGGFSQVPCFFKPTKVLLCCLFGSSLALARSRRRARADSIDGGAYGVVTDATGGTITGASLRVTSQATGEVRTISHRR